MTATQKQHWRIATGAAASIVLVGVGLWLADLSNPGRFSLDVRADRQILLFAATGFLCTITGLALLMVAVRHTTKSIPSRKRTHANIGVGLGFMLQLAGVFLSGAGYVHGLVGLALILASLPVFIWGTKNYAEGKGHPSWFGLAGIAGVFGLVLLMVLPDQHGVR